MQEKKCLCNEQRRQLLTAAIAVPALILPYQASAKPRLPRQGVRELRGFFYVNGLRATAHSIIRPGDEIIVARHSRVSFVVGYDAYSLEAGSYLKIKKGENKEGFFTKGLHLVSGAFLAAFGRSEKRITTRHATIGIRGTGIYLRARKEETYFCTCYGQTSILVNDQPEIITSVHHTPKKIELKNNQTIVSSMPMLYHSDDKNIALEEYCGNDNPFL